MKTTFTLFIGFLMIGLLGFSQPDGMIGQGHFNKILNLTNQQKEQIKSIHTTFLKKNQSFEKSIGRKKSSSAYDYRR